MELPHQDRISQTTSLGIDESVLMSALGDGYRQFATYGINQQREKWTVKMVGLTETQKDDVVDFWKAVGNSKLFQISILGTKNYRITGSTSVSNIADVFNIDFEVTEEFNIA